MLLHVTIFLLQLVSVRGGATSPRLAPATTDLCSRLDTGISSLKHTESNRQKQAETGARQGDRGMSNLNRHYSVTQIMFCSDQYSRIHWCLTSVAFSVGGHDTLGCEGVDVGHLGLLWSRGWVTLVEAESGGCGGEGSSPDTSFFKQEPRLQVTQHLGSSLGRTDGALRVGISQVKQSHGSHGVGWRRQGRVSGAVSVSWPLNNQTYYSGLQTILELTFSSFTGDFSSSRILEDIGEEGMSW